jgi:hypothetical protein
VWALIAPGLTKGYTIITLNKWLLLFVPAWLWNKEFTIEEKHVCCGRLKTQGKF